MHMVLLEKAYIFLSQCTYAHFSMVQLEVFWNVVLCSLLSFFIVSMLLDRAWSIKCSLSINWTASRYALWSPSLTHSRATWIVEYVIALCATTSRPSTCVTPSWVSPLYATPSTVSSAPRMMRIVSQLDESARNPQTAKANQIGLKRKSCCLVHHPRKKSQSVTDWILSPQGRGIYICVYTLSDMIRCGGFNTTIVTSLQQPLGARVLLRSGEIGWSRNVDRWSKGCARHG